MVRLSGSVESHCISSSRWFKIVEVSDVSDVFFLKIRINLYDEDIAYRFGGHVSTVSRNFLYLTFYLYILLVS